MTRTTLILVLISGLATTAYAQTSLRSDWDGQPSAPAQPAAAQTAPPVSRIDVVFVLDTTGSMGGLIEGAKAKIWEIANQIATAKPRPVIRMGLVAYRDRGDEYITRRTPLTTDLDAIYADLMAFRAGGGGDGPESVNQALHEAITAFDWDRADGALRLVYLVGDAPPHMDYPQDELYPQSCEAAARAGVIINTVQCGADPQTERVWREIARGAEGSYVAIEQAGGVVAIATPFDAEIAELAAKIDATVIAYRTKEARDEQSRRLAVSSGLAAAAPATAQADRAVFKAGAAGAGAVGGRQELVNDVKDGRVSVRDLKEEELPPEMQKLTAEERLAFVEAKAKERQDVQARINELNAKRQRYIDAERAKGGAGKDSFDAAVFRALKEQAARKGIEFTDRN